MNEDDITDEELEAIYEDGANATILDEEELIALVEGAGQMEKGDYLGHPFRGNQWTAGRMAPKDPTARSLGGGTGKAKTAKQKQAEIDSLNELEYHLYDKSRFDTHDESIAYAKSPEGQAEIEPITEFGGRIGVGDFMPRIVKPIKVRSDFDHSVTEEVNASELFAIPGKNNTTRGIYTGEGNLIKAARKQNAIEWLEIKSMETSGSGKEKVTEFTVSDGSKIRVHHNNKVFIWSPNTMQ